MQLAFIPNSRCNHSDVLCPSFSASFVIFPFRVYKATVGDAFKQWHQYYYEIGLLTKYSLRLQRVWRGHQARERVKQLRQEDDELEQEVAAIFIQKTLRGMAVRKRQQPGNS